MDALMDILHLTIEYDMTVSKIQKKIPTTKRDQFISFIKNMVEAFF